jgi:vancomycin permeability regulator SanA
VEQHFMLKNKKTLVAVITILVFLLHLISLYYIKYQNQNLSLSEFSLSNTGNILNLVFVAIVVFASIIFSFQDSNKQSPALFITFIIILTILLLLAVVSKHVNLFDSKAYSFRRPVGEIVTGAIFSLYQIVLIFFAMILWLGILKRNELIYLRAFVNTIIIVVVLFVFAFYFLQTLKIENAKYEKNVHSQNIAVVLGAAVWHDNKPSPSLAARVDKAVQLYKNGTVGKIQLTGSNAPGELSEAQVAFQYIKTKKIDESDIWIEDKTTSTNEQIYFIKKNLLSKKNLGKIIIVSDSYHLKRVKEICKFYNVKAQVAASDFEIEFDTLFNHKLKESIAILVFWFFAL